jgi:hypothetical protein
MAKNFWESDALIQPAKAEPLPWEADSIVKSTKAINLEAETKKYEEEVPFLQRVTDPLKAGIARLPGMLPGLEVSSIQKQINAIREGKGGPRDPVTGESLPFQPEEAEAAINMLQAQQAEAQKKVMAAQAEAGKFRVRPSVAAVSDAKTARETWELFQVDPLGVMASVSLESVPQIAPALVLGAVTRNPTVGALAMGSTSFAGELSSGVTEYFQDKGVNIKDPVEVNKALNDPVLFAEAYNHALTRGSIIAPLDAASAGLASKMLVPKQVIKNQFAKEAVNIGVAQPVAQMISGGGGEAIAQLATEGEITKPGQVLMEAAGEGPTSVLETAAFGGKQAYDRLRAGQPPVTPPVTTPEVSPVTPVTPEVVSQAVIRPEDIEEEGAPPVAPTPTPVAAAPAAIPEDNAKRIAELQAEFEQIDQAYATATPDQFAQLNARQGQIKNEIAALQSGAPVTPVTPTPTEEVKPKKEEMAPKATEVVTAPAAETELTIPIVNDKNEPVGYTDVIQPDTMYVDSGEVFVKGKDKGFHIDDIKRNLPDSPTKTALLEKADKLLQDYYKTVTGLKQPSTPDFYLRSRSSAKNIPSLGTDAVLDSTNPEVIKNIKNILKDYKIESGQSVEGNYIDAVDADLRLKEEEIKSPPVSKKSVIPTAEIRLAPYDGGFVASSSYMGKTGGYASPISVFGKFYKTRQEAIDAEANRIRKQAQEENNTVALKWLDTISKPTKESQVDINKARQAEKKAAAEKEPERKLTLEEKSAFFEKQRINQQREYAEKAKNDVRTPLKEVTDTDIDVAIKALELAGTDVEMVDAALPYLKDLERAGLIKIKPGKRKSFTKTNAGYALDRSFFTMSYQEKRQAIKDFLEGKPVKPLPEPEEEPVKTQAEINRERQAEKKSKTEKTIEVKPKIEDIVSPEVASAIKDIEFQKKLIKANNEKSITEAQFSKVFNLHQSGKTAEADAQLTKILEKKEKKAKTEEEPEEVPEVEIKEVKEFPKETPVSKEYQTALNKSRKATKAFQSAQDGYRKRLINDEEFIAARKRYDEAMAEYDIAYAKEQEKPEPKEVKPTPKKTAPVSSEEEQLIQDAVLFAKAAQRTNMEEDRIREIVENARKQDPDTVITKLKGSVDNLKKQAKDYLMRSASNDFKDQIGRSPSKDSEVVNAIKGGALNIADKDYAEAFYKLYGINESKIKKATAGTPVENQLVRFESGVFTDTDVNPEIYNKAAVQFLESPLTAKLPSRNQEKIEAKPLKDVTPLPIEKKIAVKNKTYEDHKAALSDVTAAEDVRYYLKGIYLDKANNRMMATDGHRGAIINNANFDGAPETTKGKDIVALDNSIIEGQFPDMDRVVPKKHLVKSDIINTKELGDYARGVQKAWRYIASRYNPVILKIGGKDFGFNSDYIVDMSNLFAKMGYDTFQASVNENGRLFATSPDNRVQQVVMAMREPSTPFNTYVPEKAKKVTKKSEAADIEKPADKPYYNDFTSNLDESYFDKQIVKTREDKVTDYAQARAATRRITKKVAKYGSDIPLQRELNTLLEIEQDLKYYLDMTKPVRNTAQDFMARATKELADGNISPEVESFIRNAFEKNPALLQGLRLSVRSKKTEGRENGNFNPYTRLITLWKDGSGIDNPKTIRHELAHSLELMMTPDTKKVLVDQWARALENAMKENVDEASKKYFDAVLNFLENPSKETFDAATKVMPSYDYYQYMNPSEYWAVNAEAMLGAKLGGPWLRFVNGLKKLLEGLKSFFGMDNRFVVHQVMDKLLSGEGKRLNQEGLTDYLFKGKYKIDFLNNMQEDVDLLKKYNIPSTPKTGLYNFKDKLIDSYKDFRNFKDALVATPVESTNKMIGSANDTLLFHRNKNVYFGQALESRDIKRYNGQLVNDQKIAIASVSLLNALHSGHVFTEVAVLGKMEFNPKTQMYVAAKADYSLANILKVQDKLFKKLGKQIGADIINAWFEAKRVRSIFDEFLKREANLQEAIDAGEKVEDAQRDYDNIRVAYDKIPEYFLVKDEDGNFVTQEIRNDEGEVVDEIRVINDDAVYEISQLEEKHPELRVMMDNWTKVNHNALDNAIHSGLISKTRGAQLKEIKDYVPWQRIRDDMDDVHSPGLGVAGLTNLAKERRFKKGFVESKIDDIVHNMMVNTMMLNRNSVRNHAGNAIAKEYATRGENGKIKTYPKEGVTQEGYIRANIIINGRRVIVEFRDPLVAEAVLGMESMDIPMIGALGFFAQGLRRGITSNPVFQIWQVFKDAPQAAAVTNINGKGAFSNITNPMSIYFGTLNSFFMALNPNDEIVKILKSYGIGGYQSSYRTPEKELALKMGLQTRSLWSGFLKVLDHIGDAADYAQRRSIYKRVLKETGNEMLAIVQANNVIDFLKHGSGKLAIASIRTTSFMNAYAQNMNTLATAMAGGGLKGMERKKAAALFYKTTGLFVATTLIYCFLKGGDDEYDKLDDQTKYRNYIIGDVKIPVMTSYSFFYKTMVEALYYKITRAATENEMDYKRLVKGLQKAAADALLSPNLIPTGAKPVIEIALDRNFFTGGTITPRGMENLESFQQWTAATSNLGKIISAGTGGVLNPIEADHLIRGLTGTAGVLAMSASDLFTSDKPAKTASQNPLFGPYVLAPEPRLREDLFYTFKEESDRVYDTWVKMQKRQMKGDAKQYFEENKDLIKSHGYVAKAESMLKKINGEIRRIGELPAEKMSPEEKRERITELQSTKNKVLKGVIDQRIKAGMNKYPWED